MENCQPVITPALRERFTTDWAQSRVILFSAPCGFGKTTAAGALLARHTVCRYSAAVQGFLSVPIRPDCDTVLIDDLQLVREDADQQMICEWIKTNQALHFVFLTRGEMPGWLMPFQFTGLLRVIDSKALLFDRTATARLLERNGITPTPEELTAIQAESIGYPLAVSLLCDRMAGGVPYSAAMADEVRRALFAYYEEAVYRRFPLPMRHLLLNLAPFEPITSELAVLLSGDNHAGRLLGEIQRDTTMLIFDRLDSFHFWPVFRLFLLWEMQKCYTPDEQNAVYGRAALYYELKEDYGKALDCYSRCGDHRKVTKLLVKNAEQHPGVGHYYEMERYYYAMPRAEVLQSPALLCGMSMLTSLNMDYEASEEWYHELQIYAARLKKTDAEYKDVQGKLAYLDIALPQRGSKGLMDLMGSIFTILTNKEIELPAFSVTSTLPSVMNGGKDFCSWSKKDELIYATMRKPVEAVLGRDGVGLADCALCESKFEKGHNISARMLTLMSRLGEIQHSGTPDIEFAVVGLLARLQVSQGKAAAATELLENLRTKMNETGQTRFLPNMDAMRCRIWLRTGENDRVTRWLREDAPPMGPRLRALWRYRYLTLAMVQIAHGGYEETLLLLAQLLPYCEYCARTMDALHIHLLMAICHYRLGAEDWRAEFGIVLDTAQDYRFITPVAQYGAAVLPLLTECGWKSDTAYLEKLILAARKQTVNYPDFLAGAAPLAAPLTGAEMQVLKLLCHNKSNGEIGAILGIKLATVKTHVSHVLQKLGVSRRNEARAAAEKLGLL
ncbi:MAG: LuxR C-terminal-related transcriptional regulator [Oscillospiraceae bacterium]|nr:LuxR C-terminal-related transcriptional regulator [Oscillospiraceae bacterium]